MDEAKQLEQVDQQGRDQVLSKVMQTVGDMPKEPIEAANWNSMLETVEKFFEAAGGQVETEAEGLDATGPVNEMDPKFARNVMAIWTVLKNIPGGDKYVFDIEAALSTNDGMAQAVTAITNAMNDQKFMAAATAPAPERPAPQGKPPAEGAKPPGPRGPKDMMPEQPE